MKQIQNSQAAPPWRVETSVDSIRGQDGGRILRFKHVVALVGLGKSSIYRKVQEGTFPKPIKLGSARASGWISTEVYDWIDEQIKRSRKVA